MTDLFFRSLEDLKNRIQIQSSLGGELFLCKRMEICYNKKRDDTKREVLNMAKDERNAYTIQNDASLGEVKIADEVVAIIAALAVSEGMPRKQAYEFAAQAVYGSAKMVLNTGKHPGELKDMVCSPAGTTIEAVRVLEEKGLRSAVIEAMKVCADKSRKM